MMTRLSSLFVKNLILLNITVLAMFFVGCKEPTGCLTKPYGTKVLAIGNSFTVGATESFLLPIVNESGNPLFFASAILGNSSLETHWNNLQENENVYYFRFICEDTIISHENQSLAHCIEYLDWDYIILQQLSSNSGTYNSYFPYITNLINYIYDHTSNKDVEIGFHQTWAYDQASSHGGFMYYGKNQLVMYDSIRYVAERVCRELKIKTFIPSGTAIQNARVTLGDAFCSDGYHINNLGSYIAACTWAETFFGIDCFELKVVPSTSISDESLYILRSAAHNACLTPNSVTK